MNTHSLGRAGNKDKRSPQNKKDFTLNLRNFSPFFLPKLPFFPSLNFSHRLTSVGSLSLVSESVNDLLVWRMPLAGAILYDPADVFPLKSLKHVKGGTSINSFCPVVSLSQIRRRFCCPTRSNIYCALKTDGRYITQYKCGVPLNKTEMRRLCPT